MLSTKFLNNLKRQVSSEKEFSVLKMKRLATGLLLLMLITFILSKNLEKSYPFFKIITAFSEAAMVGALADWFAVTALFKYPVGVKILRFVPFLGPMIYKHTAIIPNNKDRIGETLGNFIETHFLTPQSIKNKLEQEDLTLRFARWLNKRETTEKITEEFCNFIPQIVSVLDDKEIKRFIKDNIISGIKSLDLPSLLGNILDVLTSKNKHQEIFEYLIKLIRGLFYEYKPEIYRRINEETPWYLEIFGVDETIYNKVVINVENTLDAMLNEPYHEFRIKFNNAVYGLIDKLKNSYEYREKVEKIKEEIILNPILHRYIERVWDDIKEIVYRDIKNPDSKTKSYLFSFFQSLSTKLLEETQIRIKINSWIINAVVHILENNKKAISNLISEQVKKWDTKTMTDLIELQVGKDIQYIRINGTIIGGFIGVLIYLLSLIFS